MLESIDIAFEDAVVLPNVLGTRPGGHGVG